MARCIVSDLRQGLGGHKTLVSTRMCHTVGSRKPDDRRSSVTMMSRGEWPRLDSDKQPSALEADLLRGLELRLTDQDQKEAFTILESKCDRGTLVQFLLRIRRSRDWKSISKNEVGKAVEVLKEAQKH